jgi:hypothetical protein
MTQSIDTPTLKTYFIQVRGFDGCSFQAATASKARWSCFQAYDEAGYGHLGIRYEHRSQSQRFREFLNRIETFHHHGAVRP